MDVKPHQYPPPPPFLGKSFMNDFVQFFNFSALRKCMNLCPVLATITTVSFSVMDCINILNQSVV